MTTGTQVIVPANMQLPAHLQTAEAVAAIAAYNAAAAGGIKTGGFPRISLKGGKFHEVEGGETRTYMQPAVGSQPQLPLMCLEAVIIGANPGLSKVFYAGEYQPGDDKEPDCSSDNGITPDSHIAAPQSAACASCPQNQWGSKISKVSGKDVKACTDNKRLALIPVGDLKYKALGLALPPASLGDWGKYVKALSERGISVNAIVTNITFDATASFPKLLFSFGRFLNKDEYDAAGERAKGDDVKNITTPVRQIQAHKALPAPAVATPVAPVPAAPPPAQVPPPAAPHPAQPVTVGFGATQTAPAAAPSAVPAAPKRAPRKAAAPAAPVSDDLAHLPPHIRATVETLGRDDPTAQALLAKYPRTAALQTAPDGPDNGAPAGVMPAVPAAATAGFGGGMAPPAAPVTSAGLDLRSQLEARLRAGGQATLPAAG